MDVTFADSWAAAWNDHDLEAIIDHFAEDVTFSSPVAARIIPGCNGVIRGRDALRRYYARGLELIPDLRFEVIDTYVGVDTMVIHYANQTGGKVCEVLRFGPDDLVHEGHGTYLDSTSVGDA